jgi:hypothetical protein
MFRKFLLLSLVVPLILSLSACCGAPVREEEEVTPPSRIAFWSNRDGNREIYVMDADGSNQQRLTYDPAVEGDASWSP